MTLSESLDSVQPKAKATAAESKTLWIGTSLTGNNKTIVSQAIAKAGIANLSQWVLGLALADLKARLSKIAAETAPAPAAEIPAETPAEKPAEAPATSKPKTGKSKSK